MKKLITFVPPTLFVCLFVVLAACERNSENLEFKNDSPTDTTSYKPYSKDNHQEEMVLDSLSIMDSVIHDTLNTVIDSVSAENETHVMPVLKPTFRVFSKYMKLHSKGPIV